jgi:DivIVA domain-containing protein
MRGGASPMHHNPRVTPTTPGADDAPDLPGCRFLTEGYAAEEVDEFVDELRRALRHDPPAMAPYEVADARFKVTRVGRRYALQPVDEYLESTRVALRERHGEDAVAEVEGRVSDERHVSTLWIYLVGLAVVVAVILFAVTQL